MCHGCPDLIILETENDAGIEYYCKKLKKTIEKKECEK